MTNKVRGEMVVRVGDAELTLVPSFRRIAKLEAALGKSLLQVANSMATNGVTFTDVVLILDTMAQTPKPSQDELGNLVVRHGLVSTVPALQDFFMRVLTGGSDEGNESAVEANDD